MPPQDPDSARWFAENLQPHEPMLRAWLRSQFGKGCEVDDILQESFVRVLQARLAQEVRSPKAFLFVTARNLALMRARGLVAAKEFSLREFEHPGIVDESADIHRSIARSEKLEMLTNAIHTLPTRCRQVLTLRKLYGMSQQETAAEMDISDRTVEAQLSLAMKKLRSYFKKHAAPWRGF